MCLKKTGATSATRIATSLRNWTSRAPRIFFRLSLVIQIVRRLSSHRGGWLSDNYYDQITINKTDHNYGWPSTADNQIVLSGLAAVWQNKRTGLFQFLGEHNGRPVFNFFCSYLFSFPNSLMSIASGGRFPCCVLLALSWNTAGGGNCI